MKLLMELLCMVKISYVSYTVHDVSNLNTLHSVRSYSTDNGLYFRQFLMM